MEINSGMYKNIHTYIILVSATKQELCCLRYATFQYHLTVTNILKLKTVSIDLSFLGNLILSGNNVEVRNWADKLWYLPTVNEIVSVVYVQLKVLY